MRVYSISGLILLALVLTAGFADRAAAGQPNVAPAFSSLDTASGTVGTAFSFTVTTSGRPVPALSTADTYPPGLTATPGSGTLAISGTPTQAGSFTVNLTAANGTVPDATQALKFTIADSAGGGGGGTAFRFLTTALPDGSTNAVYAATLLTVNAAGPVTFSISAGRLPTSMTLDPATGFITGRPTVVETTSPTFAANDGTRTITFTTSIKVSAAGGGGNAGVQFTNTSLAQGRVGAVYTETLGILNGVGPFVLGAADLPPGLSMNGVTGVISGTPSAAGTFFATFTAVDKGEGNLVTTTLPLLVLPNLPEGSAFQFTSLVVDNGQLGTPYGFTLTTSGGAAAVTYSATGLPAGLGTDAATGAVSGTPTVAGSFLVVFSANDGMATISLNRTIVIAPSATSNFYWDYFGLPTAIVNQSYSRQPPILLVTKNPAPGQGATLTATGFPEGITYNTTSGEVSGLPIEVGIYPVTLTATDTAGNVLTLNFDFSVLPPKGGDVNGVPADFWVKKQSIKKSTTPAKDSIKGDYIYNADRRAGKAFDPAKSSFVFSLGSKSLTVNPGGMTASGNKFSFKSAKGSIPAASIAIDATKQTLKFASAGDTLTDTFPNTLTHRVTLGNKGFKLDEFHDTKGTFTPTFGYRKTAFVVADAKLTSGKGAGKDTATLSMLLADPAFAFMPGSSALQFRVLNGGTVLIDKLFTTLVTSAQSVDAKTGATVFKLKSSKDAATQTILAKFGYDSKSGKLTLALKGLTQALSGTELHVGVELTVGEKVYNTSVTIFAPKAGSYSTKKP